MTEKEKYMSKKSKSKQILACLGFSRGTEPWHHRRGVGSIPRYASAGSKCGQACVDSVVSSSTKEFVAATEQETTDASKPRMSMISRNPKTPKT
jgi:hypothetical protein